MGCSGSYIETAAVRGNRLGTLASNCFGITALLCGVPIDPIIRNMSSTLSNLLLALTASGTWYCVSSTTRRIVRPCIPPSALASSNRMRIPFVSGTPHIASPPDRSVWDPIVMESGPTPRGKPALSPSSPPLPQPDRKSRIRKSRFMLEILPAIRLRRTFRRLVRCTCR